MGLKKRNKVSAEFSMSSLTDIIFLLLIFFMLTSTLVRFDVVDLPEADSKTVAPTNMVVALFKDGKTQYNGKDIRRTQIERNLRTALNEAENRKGATITIVAEKGVAFKHVSTVVEIAGKLKVKAILATKAKS